MRKVTVYYCRDVIKFQKLVAHPEQWLITLGDPEQIQVAMNSPEINELAVQC